MSLPPAMDGWIDGPAAVMERDLIVAVYEPTDPVVAIVYELMRRGSVLPQTMRQVVDLVRGIGPVVATDRDVELLAEAHELCRLLPSGA